MATAHYCSLVQLPSMAFHPQDMHIPSMLHANSNTGILSPGIAPRALLRHSQHAIGANCFVATRCHLVSVILYQQTPANTNTDHTTASYLAPVLPASDPSSTRFHEQKHQNQPNITDVDGRESSWSLARLSVLCDC